VDLCGIEDVLEWAKRNLCRKNSAELGGVGHSPGAAWPIRRNQLSIHRAQIRDLLTIDRLRTKIYELTSSDLQSKLGEPLRVSA
jgi:hypothetical protein